MSFLPICGKPEDAPSFLPLCLRVMRSSRLLVREDRCRLTAPHAQVYTWEAVLAAFVSSGEGSRLRGGFRWGKVSGEGRLPVSFLPRRVSLMFGFCL